MEFCHHAQSKLFRNEKTEKFINFIFKFQIHQNIANNEKRWHDWWLVHQIICYKYGSVHDLSQINRTPPFIIKAY